MACISQNRQVVVANGFFVPHSNNKGVIENNNVALSMNGLNFVRIKYGENEFLFLLDSGSSISVIFKSSLAENQFINQKQKIKIEGIGGSVSAVGTANMKF